MRLQRARRSRIAAAAAAALAALGLAACAAVAPQPNAVTFVQQRGVDATRAQQAVREAQARLSALTQPLRRPELRRLALAARVARERINESRVGLPTFEAAEEEVPIAESEAGTGASELNYAMGELYRYARRPTAASLARYQTYFARGREKWNESVRQLWRLARHADPPMI